MPDELKPKSENEAIYQALVGFLTTLFDKKIPTGKSGLMVAPHDVSIVGLEATLKKALQDVQIKPEMPETLKMDPESIKQLSEVIGQIPEKIKIEGVTQQEQIDIKKLAEVVRGGDQGAEKIASAVEELKKIISSNDNVKVTVPTVDLNDKKVVPVVLTKKDGGDFYNAIVQAIGGASAISFQDSRGNEQRAFVNLVAGKYVQQTQVVDSNGSVIDAFAEQQLSKRIDKQSASLIYKGWAEIDSAENVAVWRIQRITKTGTIYKWEWAGGSSDFSFKWSERESLEYS